jgi:LEA14-like dessication related protein
LYLSLFINMTRYTLLGTLLIVILSSCSSPKELEYKTYHNFSIQKLGFDHSTVRLDLEYYNPNKFGMQLRNSDLDIFIDGALLGHSSFDTLIRIPRRNSFILPIKFDVNMQNIYKNAWNTLTGKEVTVKLTGKLKIGKANVFMSLPVNYETKETFSLF